MNGTCGQLTHRFLTDILYILTTSSVNQVLEHWNTEKPAGNAEPQILPKTH